MKLYYAVVHKDDDSSYGLHFPDLAGCFSAVDSSEDIIPKACEALALFFDDGEEVPKSSSLDTIRKLAEEDIKNGAMIVGIPYIASSNTTVRVNITMDSGVLSAIDSEAKRRDLSRSAFIARSAINEIQCDR